MIDIYPGGWILFFSERFQVIAQGGCDADFQFVVVFMKQVADVVLVATIVFHASGLAVDKDFGNTLKTTQ